MKKIILVLLVVLFGASLVGCIDSNITYGKVYNIKDFSIYKDMIEKSDKN